MKNIIQELYKKGILKVEIHWEAGGDDGSISGMNFFPDDRHISPFMTERLSEIGWSAYEDIIGGGTNGNFINSGDITIYIKRNGVYEAKVTNYYTDEENNEYDIDGELIKESEPEKTSYENVEIITAFE